MFSDTITLGKILLVIITSPAALVLVVWGTAMWYFPGYFLNSLSLTQLPPNPLAPKVLNVQCLQWRTVGGWSHGGIRNHFVRNNLKMLNIGGVAVFTKVVLGEAQLCLLLSLYFLCMFTCGRLLSSLSPTCNNDGASLVFAGLDVRHLNIGQRLFVILTV